MSKATIAKVRVYRSVDGDFVHDGDPRGAFLAYGLGAEIAPGDVAKYERLMSGATTKAADAYTDEDTRDELRRRLAGDPALRTPLNQEPALIGDRLATELADEAQMLAAQPGDTHADVSGDGSVFAAHAVYRTTEGELVHEGDAAAATLAYPAGARIDDADVDEYADLGEPPADEPPADEPKAAPKPPNKSRGRTADK